MLLNYWYNSRKTHRLDKHIIIVQKQARRRQNGRFYEKMLGCEGNANKVAFGGSRGHSKKRWGDRRQGKEPVASTKGPRGIRHKRTACAMYDTEVDGC